MSEAFIEAYVDVEKYGPYKRLAIDCGEIREVAFLDRNQCRTLARFLGDFMEAPLEKSRLMSLNMCADQEMINVKSSSKFCVKLAINNVEAHMESWEARRLMEDLLDWEGEP